MRLVEAWIGRGRWTGWLSPDGTFHKLSQDDGTHNGFIENDAVREEDGEASLLGMDFDAFARWSHKCDTNGNDYFAETACRLGWVVVRQADTTLYLENFWKPINRKQKEWAEDRRTDGLTTSRRTSHLPGTTTRRQSGKVDSAEITL